MLKNAVNVSCAERAKQYPKGTLHADDARLFPSKHATKYKRFIHVLYSCFRPKFFLTFFERIKTRCKYHVVFDTFSTRI